MIQPKSCLNNNKFGLAVVLAKKSLARKSLARKGFSFALCLFCLAVTLIFSSCGNKKNEPLIIWTDIPEFASYAELFNKEHNDANESQELPVWHCGRGDARRLLDIQS